jgi:hypothetical protein
MKNIIFVSIVLLLSAYQSMQGQKAHKFKYASFIDLVIINKVSAKIYTVINV